MITRRALMMVCVLASTVGAMPAFAGAAPLPFTQEAFDAAQKAGKPILIDTFATWCDVCARQKPILDQLLQAPKFKDLVTFRVDFDTQKDVMRQFNARVQSTLIVFRGGKEVGRSVGETQPEWIEDLLDKTGSKSES
jgi:thioredoxin-like negative regulator of GroEL